MGHQYDYIIIGSGIAGLLTAWHASKKRHSVLIVSKGSMTQSNTFYAQGGIAAAVHPKDSTKSHIEDTLKAGHHKNDPKAVNFIIKKAPYILRELAEIGIPFAGDLKLEGGHSHNRISYNKDSIGKTLVQTLTKKIRSNPTVHILNNHFVTDLIISNNQCVGISFISNKNKDQRIKNLYARRVVICTGGTGQLFEKTTNPMNATGDGIAIAHRAGCEMQDLQHIQFHPTALNLPPTASQSHLFLLSETLRGEEAHLLNKKIERFMLKAHPLAELAPRDILSKHIFQQLKQGPVHLDLRHIPTKTLKQKYPSIYSKLLQHKLNPKRTLIPISPAAHYLCGGIKTNLHAQTSIKNLYAAGESAHTGLHGANRLASNSLLEAAVMAKQATILPLTQKKYAQQDPPTNKRKESPTTIKKIKKIMWQNANPLATKTELKQALKQIKSLPHPTNPSETLNMLQTAELILKAKISTPPK